MSSPKRKPEPRVPKRTLAAVVTSQIRERIIAGAYPPGTQLNEGELAARFATSRGPVREGLQRLVQEGLLISTPHKGIAVRVLTADDLDDLYFARAALERAALQRLTSHGAPAALIANLEQAVEQLAQAVENEDWHQVSAADLRFHQHIVNAARSERLSLMYGSLADQTRLGLNLMLGTYKGRTDLVDEHRELLKLISAGDRPAVLEALDRHFGEAMITLRHHTDTEVPPGPGRRA
ncbi:GntR family transcriptional regulator [Saccharopolyspora sp. WRP15-2]|uniref:GntR family transcriptional regulator n=1 Tax=Saccharopolyspora oryzae TaxID=2997343 RepID=A0ABT4UV14_9PSEU|nr:GntR family transcriptional regulator [Saccharopolyspora oryzae]MDA3625519.1 GntR family transcriptional regulator [Saccharopolyspora oryzae]